MLKIPDVRQKHDHDCGAACIDAVLRFHGVAPPLNFSALANPVQGTAPDTIEAVLRAAGLPVVSGTMDLGDLAYNVSRKRPVICPVSLHGGHWVVVGEIGHYTIAYHDPLDGLQSMQIVQWLPQWTDFTRNGHAFTRWGIAVGPRQHGGN
jgi:ABC-type bacteriocin/lantibiotic exporter with double-glycine peptidase domain